MNKQVTLRVADIVGGSLCISADDGQKVFEKVSEFIRDSVKVTLSFERVTTLISLFLNASIGQLYGTYSEAIIREFLSVEELADDDIEMLKRVIENAKKYYLKKGDYDNAWSSEGDEDEE